MVLTDFKALLSEGKQNVLLLLLQELYCMDESMLDSREKLGCAFCGGLGHHLANCPTLKAMLTMRVSICHKHYLAHTSVNL